MGELNPPAPVGTVIAGDMMEYVAKYLYDRYETDPHPMSPDDPRVTGIGDSEPWESAGKRMREKWDGEARDLLAHVAAAFTATE